ILQEKWTARDGLFDRLGKKWRFAIFTGRTREEARLTLDRCAPHLAFDPIIGSKDVENLKPAPDGIVTICAGCPDVETIYIGDTVDDARSARAAGVGFIGVASAENTRRTELMRLFESEGARAVLESINELE